MNRISESDRQVLLSCAGVDHKNLVKATNFTPRSPAGANKASEYYPENCCDTKARSYIETAAAIESNCCKAKALG